MTRPNRRYTDEFKRQAVQFYASMREFRTMGEIADELGIHPNNLRRWLKEAAPDEVGAAPLSDDERAELKRLRAENRMLKEELEVSKKADAFFANRRTS